jgi:hypothetical protein
LLAVFKSTRSIDGGAIFDAAACVAAGLAAGVAGFLAVWALIETADARKRTNNETMILLDLIEDPPARNLP